MISQLKPCVVHTKLFYSMTDVFHKIILFLQEENSFRQQELNDIF
jgi:hypothetical protein